MLDTIYTLTSDALKVGSNYTRPTKLVVINMWNMSCMAQRDFKMTHEYFSRQFFTFQYLSHIFTLFGRSLIIIK